MSAENQEWMEGVLSIFEPTEEQTQSIVVELDDISSEDCEL